MHGWRAVLLVAIVAGLALTNQVRSLNVLAYALIAAVSVAGAWSLASARGIDVRRLMRVSRAQVGETVEEKLTIRNRWPLPRPWLDVQDLSTLPGHRASLALGIGPGSTRTWRVRTVCRRRGEYTIGPTNLIGTDPLGIFVSKRRLSWSHRLLVYPRIHPIDSFELPSLMMSGGPQRQSSSFASTPQASDVREYHPGDPLNRIHWPSSARAGKLISKEFDEDPTADVWMLIDLERSDHVGEGDESTEEYAVSIAASIASHLLAQGRQVGMVTTGSRQITVAADRGERQLTRILEVLAVAKADGTTPLSEEVTVHSTAPRRGSAFIVVTPSTTTDWIPALQAVKYRGVTPVAVLLEASTFGEAPTSLECLGGLIAASVAHHLVKMGDTLGEALRGNGARLAGRG